MADKNRIKGIVFSLAGAVALSYVYIFSKAALSEIHLAQFGFYWFALGLIWNLIYILKIGKLKLVKTLNRKAKWILIIIGLIELAATLLFFITITIIENPAIVSFIANLNPFFVAIFGITILKERFTGTEIIGMLLTLTGTFVICYHGNSGLSDFFIDGSYYIMLAAFLYAISVIIAKRNINNIDPAILSFNRVLYLFTFSTIMMFALNQSFVIPVTAIKHIAIGSFLGPFINSITYYIALKYIEAARATMIRSSRSIFVLIAAYFYLGKFPLEYQVIGGMISITGIVFISLGQARKGIN